LTAAGYIAEADVSTYAANELTKVLATRGIAGLVEAM